MQTKMTRTGERDMTNRKPYRTAAQKIEARNRANKVDGRWVTTAPVCHHRAPKRGGQ